MDHIVTMNIDDLDDEPCMGPAFDAQLRRLPPGTTFSYSMVPRRIVAIAEETAREAAEAEAAATKAKDKLMEAVAKMLEADAKVKEADAKAGEAMAKAVEAAAKAAEAKARLVAAVKASA
jgi:hypothetical protein